MSPTRKVIRKQGVEPRSAFITIRGAAARLGISEGLAYRMANEYLTSYGAAVIPCCGSRSGRP